MLGQRGPTAQATQAGWRPGQWVAARVTRVGRGPCIARGARVFITQPGSPPWHSYKDKMSGELVPIDANIVRLTKGGAAAKDLPPVLCSMTVRKVEFTGTVGLSVDASVVIVADVAKAVERRAAGSDEHPWLVSSEPHLSFSFTARPYAHKLGTLDRDLVQMALPQLLTFGRVSAVAKVLPVVRAGNSVEVPSSWPESGELYLDMPASLQHFVLVSEAFIKKYMCEDSSQFICDRQLQEETAYQLPEKVLTMPKLGTAGWKHQELTSASWKFSSLHEAGVKEFRVVFPGCVEVLAAKKRVASDVAEGEAAVAQAATDAETTTAKFLSNNTLVYALA